MTISIFPSLILPSVSADVTPESLLFEDNFESYSVGSFPTSGGWELVWNGMGTAYQVVTDSVSYSPTKSLQLWGQDGWSANAQKTFTTDSDIIGYEVYMQAEQNSGTGSGVCEVEFWDRDGATWGKRMASVVFMQDGNIYVGVDSWGTPAILIGSYDANRWYKIRTVIDRTAGTFSVWIDDSLVVNSVVIEDTYQIKALMLGSGHAGVKGFFDDVKIFTIEQPQGELVGYWNFDEGSGPIAADSSGNGNTGTLMNDPQWGPGVSGTALSFDGINDYVRIPHSSSLNIAGNEISVEYWIKLSSNWYPQPGMPDSYSQILYDKGDAYTAAMIIGSGALRFNIPYVPPYPETNKNTWDANTWYHIANVFDGSQIRIYVNGVLDKAETVIGSVSQSSLNLAIGSHCFGGKNFFTGVIDEFAIYDYARTAEQILANYDAYAPPGPVGYWNFDEGEGNAAFDSSGNGNVGTLVGSQWVTGVAGSAVNIDGVNDYVLVPTSSSLAVQGNAISLECWIKLGVTIDDSNPSIISIIDKGDEYTFQINPNDGRIWFAVILSPGPINWEGITTSINSWTAGTWYHIVGTYDGSYLSIYVNGVLSNSRILSGNLNSPTSFPFTIGAHSLGFDFNFNGDMDEVKIYNYARTPEQVMEDYLTSAPQQPTALLSVWPTLIEMGNDVTLYGTTSFDPDGTVVSYLYDFGDGSESDWISIDTMIHTYSNPGIYETRLKVKDNDGLESEWSNIVPIEVKGTGIRVAIIFAKFSPDSPTPNTFNFDNYVNEIVDYFDEVSYGSVDLTVELFGLTSTDWLYSVPNDQNYYGAGKGDLPNSPLNREMDFAWDVILAADADVDFDNYDMVVTVHPGYGEEQNIQQSDMWSQFSARNEVTTDTLDGEADVARNWIVVAENTPNGVWIHEVAHGLGQVLVSSVTPDLYSANNAGSNVGFWGLMGEGNWLPNWSGTRPDHLSSYSKEFLDWLEYSETGYGTTTIESLATMEYKDTIAIYNLGLFSNSYYILECRTNDPMYSDWDTECPSTAFVLYRVEQKGNNVATVNVVGVMNSNGDNYDDVRSHVQFSLIQSIAESDSFSMQVDITNTKPKNTVGAVLETAAEVLLDVIDYLYQTSPYDSDVFVPDIDLHAYTNDGLHIGINYLTGEFENEIPGALVSGDLVNGEEWIFVPEGIAVYYTVNSHDIQQFLDQIEGSNELTNGIENYQLSLVYYDSNENRWEDEPINENIEPGTSTAFNPIIIENPDGSYSTEMEKDIQAPVISITKPVQYGIYTVDSGESFLFGISDNLDPNPIVTASVSTLNGDQFEVTNGDRLPTITGVYTLQVIGTDLSGNSATEELIFIIYDPDGGFATGGGWFITDEESTLPYGRANFGFVAKYQKGKSTGNLEFQYQDADINLKSTTIDWLTISSNKVIFQGTGTINNEGLYTFRVMATDTAEPGVNQDHFDIKIWEGTDTEEDPIHKAKNTLSGGNIKVHKKIIPSFFQS